MHYVYVLCSKKDRKLYIGCTSDISKRLTRHQNGLVKSTQARRPLELIYKEGYDDVHEAFRIERFYKTPKGKRELKEKLGDRLTVGQRPLEP